MTLYVLYWNPKGVFFGPVSESWSLCGNSVMNGQILRTAARLHFNSPCTETVQLALHTEASHPQHFTGLLLPPKSDTEELLTFFLTLTFCCFWCQVIIVVLKSDLYWTGVASDGRNQSMVSKSDGSANCSHVFMPIWAFYMKRHKHFWHGCRCGTNSVTLLFWFVAYF